jgi:hypothetical protein
LGSFFYGGVSPSKIGVSDTEWVLFQRHVLFYILKTSPLYIAEKLSMPLTDIPLLINSMTTTVGIPATVKKSRFEPFCAHT